MRKLIFVLFTLIITATACSKQEQTVKSDDITQLENQLKKIADLVDTATCNNSKQWSFTAIGSKACGGPTGYIAYPHSIDTTAFLKLVSLYTQTQKEYNIKHNIISNCMMEPKPYDVICDNGKPVLIYANKQ